MEVIHITLEVILEHLSGNGIFAVIAVDNSCRASDRDIAYAVFAVALSEVCEHFADFSRREQRHCIIEFVFNAVSQIVFDLS